MKKFVYVLAITLIIAMLVISSNADIPLTNASSDTDNNLSYSETSVVQTNDDSFIQRLKRLLTGEIIDVDISDTANINPNKINGTYLTSIDITTGQILFNENPEYITNVGFIVDVSSKIPTGFALIDVNAKGRKVHQITGEIQNESPLNLYPIVNGTNIEIQVWDASGDEFGGANWATMSTHIKYTLFMKK